MLQAAHVPAVGEAAADQPIVRSPANGRPTGVHAVICAGPLPQGEDIATTQNFVKDTVPPTGEQSRDSCRSAVGTCRRQHQRSTRGAPERTHACRRLAPACLSWRVQRTAWPPSAAVLPEAQPMHLRLHPCTPAVVFTRAGSDTSPLAINPGAAAPASTPDATALFEFTGSDSSGVNFSCTVSAT